MSPRARRTPARGARRRGACLRPGSRCVRCRPRRGIRSDAAPVSRNVGRGGDASAPAGPVGVEKLAALFIDALVGVRAEVVALGLQQVGRQARTAVAVEESECRGEGGHRNSGLDRPRHHGAPGFLVLVDEFFEEVIEQQVGQRRVFVVGRLYFPQELAPDDAAAAPHERDGAVIKSPFELPGRLAHEHEALGVRNDFGGVERLLKFLDNGGFASGHFGLGPFQRLGGNDSLVLDGRQAARKHRFGNQGERDAKVERRDAGPLARALLPGRVEDFIDNGLAVFVVEPEDVAGDFDEVAVELALIPLGEDLVHFAGLHAQAVLHDLVGFADELHVAVLDAVVHHFDEVARAVFAHPFAAGGAVLDLG